MKDAHLSLDRRKQIALDIASGINALHSNHIAHKDLRLGNILLNAAGTVKVSEFGLSATLGQQYIT